MKSGFKTLALTVLLFGLSFPAFSEKRIKLKYERKASTKISEPSDIVWDSVSNHCYIVSDNGTLFECDSTGAVLRKSDFEGVDFEGVTLHDGKLYVVEERLRKVYVLDTATLRKIGEYDTPNGGKPNSGCEGIAWNEARHTWVLVKEKSPVSILEYDEQFHQIHEYPFDESSDLSGAYWWNGALYVLSDEDACIFRLNPQTYAVEQKYTLVILNPEALCFLPDGTFRIASDLMQAFYFFPKLSSFH